MLVADLRYVPNAHAQLLARPQRGVVGVVVHDDSDPCFAEVTRGCNGWPSNGAGC
ncbi:hypothetical protein C5N14_17790 [Micromonospora sp. MW-13]|uniref:hypothetical protein n=1 Tax=Micromonospora sp. MW-13 TaxID=2094022 RepID=UPI000EC50289|nr:hypothetical protein C5N14_17790 [Micromonospora sp. MW-13]